MREIKFRAWLIQEKQMVNVATLHLGRPRWVEPKEISGKWFAGRYELMQYTGLKDKKGKEIYEGDILAPPKRRFPPEVVQLYQPKIQYRLARERVWAGIALTEKSVQNLEVIGNIHENPELLK